MIKIEIATIYLTAMLAVATTKAPRYSGVHLNARDKKLEATDGCAALVINYPLPDELNANITLPVTFVADCVKSAKSAKQDFVTMEYNPADGSLITDLYKSVVLRDPFPPLERIFPTQYDEPSCFIDVNYINMFHTAMKAISKFHKIPCVWNPVFGISNGNNKCAVMTWKDIAFIVMGTKIEDKQVFSTADVMGCLYRGPQP